MEKTKIRIVSISLLFTLIVINSLIVIGTNLKGFNRSNYSTLYPDIQSTSTINLDIEDFNVFSQEFSLFGYKLIAEAKDPIDWDEEGVLTMTQKKFNFVDISLKLEAREYNYNDVPIYGKMYFDKAGTQAFCYHVEDPLRGFFMGMVITSNVTYIDLAFDGGECQLCYEGLDSRGHSTFNAYFPQKIEVIYLSVENLMKPEFQSLSFTELEYKLKIRQRNNIKIFQRESEDQPENGRSVSFTDYGIAHEQADFDDVNLAEYLPDYYWEPYTEIDVGIYRRVPGEAQIKSDLQYYNRDYIQGGHGYVRDIKAYAIYAHGLPDMGTAWFMHWIIWPFWGEWLWPSEIIALWYHSYDPGSDIEVDVYPWNMIIHATVCFGYSETPSSTPYMAKSFVDYGAAAFVSAAGVGIPRNYNDQFTMMFWQRLCEIDQTVYQATQAYIARHNQFVGHYGGEYDIYWYYNNQIKIYGNTQAILPN